MVNDPAGVVLDRLRVEFDDERAVANAGLLLPATLASRLGIEQLVDETVDLSGRPGGARPGRKVLTLVHAMQLGADSIDDCDVLQLRPHPAGARARRIDALDVGNVSALLHLRACAGSTESWPSRCGAPGRPGAGPRRGAAADRPRRRRGARLREGGRLLRVHARAATTRCSRPAPAPTRCGAERFVDELIARVAGRWFPSFQSERKRRRRSYNSCSLATSVLFNHYKCDKC